MEEIHLYYKTHMPTAYKDDEKAIKKIVEKYVTPVGPETKIILTTYYKTGKTSQLLLINNPTSKTPPMQKSHVIYEYTCPNEMCQSHKYIGMTKTRLTRRLTMHLQFGPVKQHYTQMHNKELTRQDLEEGTAILDVEGDPRRLQLLLLLLLLLLL